jgi:hypothetical protein
MYSTIQYSTNRHSSRLCLSGVFIAYNVMVSFALCTLPIKRIEPSIVCNICNQIFHNNSVNLSTYSKERKCLICLDIMPTPSTSKNMDSAKLDELEIFH